MTRIRRALALLIVTLVGLFAGGCQKPFLVPTAFDLNAACSGFVYGTSVVAGMVESGFAERVLLVGAEKPSNVGEVDGYTRRCDAGTSARVQSRERWDQVSLYCTHGSEYDRLCSVS